MARRVGPGPVFVYESLIFARRRQVYAGRVLFVLAMLVGLGISWWNNISSPGSGQPLGSGPDTLEALARAGVSFFFALAGIQLSMVLLVAPAATAGALCQDRARGILAQMATTDLSDSEIVLGKLFSRLAPILALLACALPVVSLAALLGGIDGGALVGLFAVSAAVAVLGCALALAISVEVKKTDEVVMGVLAFITCWLLACRSGAACRGLMACLRRRIGSTRPIRSCWCMPRIRGRATSACSRSRSSWPGPWRSRPDCSP